MRLVNSSKRSNAAASFFGGGSVFVLHFAFGFSVIGVFHDR